MKSFRSSRSSIVAALTLVFALGTGVATAAASTQTQTVLGEGHLAQSEATMPAPPPLTDEMVADMGRRGTTITPEPRGEGSSNSDRFAALAATGGVQGFRFLTDENVRGISYGPVNVPSRPQLNGRRVWALYLDSVVQPLLGGSPGEVDKPGQMFVLIDPVTFEFIYAQAY